MGADNEAVLGSRKDRSRPVLAEATMMTKKLTQAYVRVAEAIMSTLLHGCEGLQCRVWTVAVWTVPRFSL